MRHLSLLCLALGFATFTTACGSAPVAPTSQSAQREVSSPPPASVSAPVRMTVSYSSVGTNTLPLWIGQDAGIFQEHGLAVDGRLITGASYIAALMAGETPVAHGGGSEAITASAGGADVAVIGTLGSTYPFFFEVPATIRTVADLKGKTLGVTAIGTPDYIATRVVLSRNGLDPDKDVTIQAVGLTTRMASLENGAIQGGMLGISDKLVYEAHGGHALFDLAALNIPAATTAIEVKRSWLAQNQPLAQKYIDALVESIARLKSDRSLSIDLLRKNLKTDDQTVLDATYDYAVRTLPALPYPAPEQFADFVTELGKLNPQVAGFDPSMMLDPSLIKSAENRGLAAGR